MNTRVVGAVRSVAEIENKLYVVFYDSSNIRVYDAHTFNERQTVAIQRVRKPRDIVACRFDRQLYVAEDYSIWRVSIDEHSYTNWLTTESPTNPFSVTSLSLTSRYLLVTSRESRTLRQYNVTDSQLLHFLQLPSYMRYPFHAVATIRHTFVIGHQGTSQDESKFAVIDMFSFTILDKLMSFCNHPMDGN